MPDADDTVSSRSMHAG